MAITGYNYQMTPGYGSASPYYPGMGGGGTLGYAQPRGYDPAYGGIPQVPNPGSTSIDAILSGINNLGYINQLSSGLTQIGSADAMQPLTSALPGLSGTLGTLMGNAASESQGNIPSDVLRNLQQGAAARGVQGGMAPGSSNTNAAYLQALGLTSLDMSNLGQKNTIGLMNAIPKGPQFDPSSLITTPKDQQMWQYLSNVLGAAPVPYWANRANMNALTGGLGAGGGAGAGGYGGGGMDPIFQMMLTGDQNYAPGGGSTPRYPDPGHYLPQTSPGDTSSTDQWWQDALRGGVLPGDYSTPGPYSNPSGNWYDTSNYDTTGYSTAGDWSGMF